jgi:hypothetical protein
MRSLKRNGSTPLNVCDMGMSPAILLIIKTLRPTGGVIRPTSTTIRVSIPNQIAVSSPVSPKSRVIMSGKKMGIVSKIIARLSIKHPRTKYKNRISIKI